MLPAALPPAHRVQRKRRANQLARLVPGTECIVASSQPHLVRGRGDRKRGLVWDESSRRLRRFAPDLRSRANTVTDLLSSLAYIIGVAFLHAITEGQCQTIFTGRLGNGSRAGTGVVVWRSPLMPLPRLTGAHVTNFAYDSAANHRLRLCCPETFENNAGTLSITQGSRPALLCIHV